MTEKETKTTRIYRGQKMLQSIYVKVLAALLLAFLMLSVSAMPVSAQAVPFMIKGYASVDGVPMNGVAVSCNGVSTTTGSDSGGNAGFYAIMPSASNGSPVVVSFSYGGKTASVTVTANGGTMQAPSANLVTPQSSSGSGSSISYMEAVKATARASATPTPTATVTIQPAATPVPTQAPTASPTETPQQDNTVAIYLVIGVVAGLAIAGAAYYLFARKP
jgi:hypothetical protein